MVKFSIFHNSKFYSLLMLLAMALVCSCSKVEDFHVDDDGKDDPVISYTDTIKVLQRHTEGEGFPIIIMADGYTVNDISNSTYRNAVMKTKDALFSMEPMKSLEKYFDIIEVAVPSKERGISSKKKDTAFKTYYVKGNATDIYGDSITVERWMTRALIQEYKINTQTALNSKSNKTLCIVLLNCSIYKGVTLLAYDESTTDSIPGGFSISYFPVEASIDRRDVFADLVQHEAVGHGIGKLADEYYEPSNVSPAAENLEKFHLLQRYGLAMNISYNDTTTCDRPAKDIRYATNKTLRINSHPYYPSDIAYPLTQDPRYSNEDMQWYQGGYTFLTYNEEKPDGQTWYECRKEFYSPSYFSTMNATTDPRNKSFNALSRLMIYKRVMRAALGYKFKCNLFNAEDMEAFATFDAPARITAASAKAKSSTTLPAYLLDPDAPRLASPRIIKSSIQL